MSAYGKMDPGWKAKWVAALRSGRYAQGKGHLRRGSRYCCLGVLCEIHPDVTLGMPALGVFVARSAVDGDQSTTALPIALAETVGLSGMETGELVYMNDIGGNFPRIADWIEANL